MSLIKTDKFHYRIVWIKASLFVVISDKFKFNYLNILQDNCHFNYFHSTFRKIFPFPTSTACVAQEIWYAFVARANWIQKDATSVAVLIIKIRTRLRGEKQKTFRRKPTPQIHTFPTIYIYIYKLRFMPCCIYYYYEFFF